MKNREEEYALAVVDSLLNLFRDEEENGNSNYHYDIDKIDATKFFTGMIIGCNVVFSKLTQSRKTHLEFTHLANQLIVQYLLENKDETEV